MKNNLWCGRIVHRKTHSTQILRIMRLTVFFLLFIIFETYALDGYSQNQKVTMNKGTATFAEIIRQIEKQTDYLFIYNEHEIALDKRIAVSTRETTVAEILNRVLQGTGFSYTMEGNHIILVKSMEKMKNVTLGRKITGTVKDDLGEAIVGCNVAVKGEKIGAITDMDGRYTIEVPDNSILVFSFLGYKSVESPVKNNSVINITMQEDSRSLEEVVVVGYGTQKKVNLTGAVSVVEGDQLAGRSASTMSQLLQGAVPNMTVSFSSGRAGDGGSFNIRGVNSISGSAKPLVLIDGVEGDVNRVNPNDVASVSVLKDASSAAIYGARAAYGVILVTTKTGEKGKVTLNYNGRYSFSDVTTSTDYETRGYYAAGISDMFFSTWQGTPLLTYTEKDYHELWIRRNDKTEQPERPWVVTENGQYKYYGNFDWYNYLYDHKRPTHEHNVSISGGSEHLKFRLSGGYYNQKGVLKIQPDKYERYNFKSRLEAKVTPWLSVSNNTSYFKSNYSYPGLGGVNTIFKNASYRALPILVPVHPDGTLVYETNIMNYTLAGTTVALSNKKHNNKDEIDEFMTTFEVVINPIKHVEIIGNYTYSKYDKKCTNRSVDMQYSKVPGVTITMPESTSGGNKLTVLNTKNLYYAYNAYGTYGNLFAGSHNVKLTGGINYETKSYEDLTVSKDGLLSDELNDFNLAKGENTVVTGGKNKYALFGVFYRANYDYKGRYLFEASGRYDGSSRFKKGHRYGFFPSFSAGWRISEKPFYGALKNTVDNLKLRLSYGTLGNQQVGYYDYLQQIETGKVLNYSFGDKEKASYAYETAPNASDLTWETVVTKNIGLDIGIFNNRLNISADAYIRDTKDMLMPGKALPSVYGAKSPNMNAADLRTKGWELVVAWNDRFNVMDKPFNYGVSFGIGDNVSKITKYDNPNKEISSPYVGQRLGDIWGYMVDGYFATDEEAANYGVDQSVVNYIINNAVVDRGLHAGDMKYLDLDGNNKIEQTVSANDIKDQRIIGNSLPRYTYSIRLNAEWNGIDFSVFFQGVGKQDWYPSSDAFAFWGPYSSPAPSFIPKDFLADVWSVDNPDAYFPRPRGYIAWTDGRSLSSVNNRYLQSLAYCRLKNLTVGYTLPVKWLSKIHVQKARLYFSGENLLTLDRLDTDYIDPEAAAAGTNWKTGKTNALSYPFSKTYSFGIDITF